MSGLAMFIVENLVALIEHELVNHNADIQKLILSGIQAELAKGIQYIEQKLAHK